MAALATRAVANRDHGKGRPTLWGAQRALEAAMRGLFGPRAARYALRARGPPVYILLGPECSTPPRGGPWHWLRRDGFQAAPPVTKMLQ
jgi:hypothetical protein